MRQENRGNPCVSPSPGPPGAELIAIAGHPLQGIPRRADRTVPVTGPRLTKYREQRDQLDRAARPIGCRLARN